MWYPGRFGYAFTKALTATGSLGGSKLNRKGTGWKTDGTSWSLDSGEVVSGAEHTVISGTSQAGHSGLPEISGRAFRVFNISGFQQLNPNSSPKFRVPVSSGTNNYGFGFGYPQTTRYYYILIEQHTHRE